jgi:hypothetical protein
MSRYRAGGLLYLNYVVLDKSVILGGKVTNYLCVIIRISGCPSALRDRIFPDFSPVAVHVLSANDYVYRYAMQVKA